MPKSWTCSCCGKEHPFGVWVAAHWNESLIHSCDCGAKHEIRRGVATLRERPKA